MKAKFLNKLKVITLFLAVLVTSSVISISVSYAQEKDSDHNEVFTSVEHTPEFPGGMDQFYKYIGSSIKYPADAREKKVEGRVIVTFIVEKDGSLSNVKSLRSPNESLQAEAIRVISGSPKWKPGTQNSHVVRVQYTVPVVFSLDGKTAITFKPSGEAQKAYYIIDGKPAGVNALQSLDANDIETVNVLKGKDATDKYGEKGKFGVVEIITKKQ